MFTLEGKLTFINIEQNYLKKLHSVCSEVYYKESNYERKPYIGILINANDKKYVIPLSSAKEKHKLWKNVDKGCYLIYEESSKSNMGKADVWVETEEERKYKDLLNKEYIFCLKIIDDVVAKANSLYDKQMKTGKIARFCCDFKALEAVKLKDIKSS